MQSLLHECRERLGPAPRRFAWRDRRYLEPAPPSSIWRDPLRVVYRERRLLLERGEVVWARLVQANQALFEPGHGDLPAVVVFSPDPFFDARPDGLGRIARGLFALKNTQPQDPELAALARAVTGERERLLNSELPRSLAQGRQAFYTTIMVMRSHLPLGLLQSGIFPLLALPSATRASIILPSRFWAPSLLYAWHMIAENAQ